MGAGALSITAVYASRLGQNLHLEVEGKGFGAAPRTLPAVTALAQFSIKNTTAGGWCAGYNSCPVYLQYTSWTDKKITIDGFGSQYGGAYKLSDGDLVEIVVNGAGGESVKWTGTLEPKAPPPLLPDGPTPQVCTVDFSRIGQNIHVEVNGAGFGPAPRTLPAVTALGVFQLKDTTAGGWCAGYNSCPVYLQYTSWTDGKIVVDGFGSQYGGAYKAAPGDAVSLFIQNSSGPEFTVWNGTLKPGTPPPLEPLGPTPHVEKVTFTQVGQNMRIQVDGAGFGDAPRTLPATTATGNFQLTDVTQGGWCAGYNSCPVYLQYSSWTPTRIVIDGFGTQYGGNNKVVPGDKVSLFILNHPGPEFTIWEGTLPTE